MLPIEQLLYQWLLLLKIPISKKYLRRLLVTHPDYPSLLSVTDTLSRLGLNHIALNISKNHLTEVPVPFLAHLNGKAGELIIVNNLDVVTKKATDFYQRWSGVVVAIEKPAAWENTENEVHLRQEQQQRKQTFFAILLVSALSILAMVKASSWVISCLILTAVSGFIIAYLIITKELGIENKIMRWVCARNADCNKVINSDGPRLLGGLRWGDLGISWFFCLLFLIIFSSFTGIFNYMMPVMLLLSVATLPFTIYSVYYQRFVIRNWCNLCLIICGLLWVQFFLLMQPLTSLQLMNMDSSSVLFTTTLLVSVGFIWLTMKRLWNESSSLSEENHALKRFKFNPEVFVAVLRKQRKVDVTPFLHDLQLGNPKALLQIVVACNPYCNPCADAHKVLHQLIEKREYDLGLTIRFTVNTIRKSDKKIHIAEYIMQYVQMNAHGTHKAGSIARELIKAWFAKMNYSEFEQTFPLNANCNVDELLMDHETWTNESNITGTPTIFINGYELPKTYSAGDLLHLLPGLKDNRVLEDLNENFELVK